MEACREDGVEPLRQYSGKFQVRAGSRIHEGVTYAAKMSGQSMNSWVTETLEKGVREAMGN